MAIIIIKIVLRYSFSLRHVIFSLSFALFGFWKPRRQHYIVSENHCYNTYYEYKLCKCSRGDINCTTSLSKLYIYQLNSNILQYTSIFPASTPVSCKKNNRRRKNRIPHLLVMKIYINKSHGALRTVAKLYRVFWLFIFI